MLTEPAICQNKSDEEVVKLILKNPDLYLCLMKRYEGKLFWYLKRISGLPDDDLEDLLQEVFIKAYQNLRDFDPSLKFSSWIYRIAHNHAISQYRKSKARPLLLAGEEADIILDKLSGDSDLEDETFKKMRIDELKEVISRLEPKYGEVIILRYLEEKDYTEISDILKKPVGTVATLLSRAKKQLLTLINQKNIEL